MEAIKVGFCVAYDWHFLQHTLPLVYEGATDICLAIDRNRISWSGNPYSFDEEAFRQCIANIDSNKKIRIYEDGFYLPNLTPMQNEVRERNMIAQFFGEGGWHIQLDCDEHFVGFGNFAVYLRSLSKERTWKANVCCAKIVLFKVIEEGFLYIYPLNKEKIEFMQVATREPKYEYGRRNGYFNLYTNFCLLDQSWARTEAEVKEKIFNWGHSVDVEPEAYLKFWMSLNRQNYNEVSNLHYHIPEAWPSLRLAAYRSVREMVGGMGERMYPQLTTRDLLFKNSRFLSRLRALRDMIFSSRS